MSPREGQTASYTGRAENVDSSTYRLRPCDPLVGLVRGIDLTRRRHVYAVGSLPHGEVVGELGSLLQVPEDDAIPVWMTAEGWLATHEHPPRVPPTLRGVCRWMREPVEWGEAATAARAREVGRRALASLISARRSEPDPVCEPPAGYLRAERGLPLYASRHPVTGDQLLSTTRGEARELGYAKPTLLGYLVPYAEVTSELKAVRRPIPWARLPELAGEPSGRPSPPGALDSPPAHEVVQRESCQVSGWAVLPSGPARKVEIFVDGAPSGRAHLGRHRRDVVCHAPLGAEAHAPICGFEHTILPSELPEGQDTVAVDALVHGADGHFRLPAVTLELAPPNDHLRDDDEALAGLRERVRQASGARVPPRSREMRLLAFTDSLDGGREQREFFGQLRRLANRDDVSCAVVAAEGGRYRKEIEALGFPVHVTSGYGGVTSAEYEGKMRELAGVARQAGCNLVLANGFGSFRAVDLACRLGVPSVWAIHEGLDVPDWGTADHRIALHRSYARERLELALREASSVVLSGEATRALYERYGNPTSLVTLPRGVDLSDVPAPQDSREALDERRRRDLPASATVVLCVAPIQPHEGHGFLAQAFAEVSDAHPEAILVMVGDHGTPYVAGLRQYLERSCLSARTRVEPPASQPYEWHGIADALVFAAETPPSPIAMLEEMTFASPVIAARAPSVADLIEDGRTGYLYDQSDVKDLARTLDRVVGAGPEGRAAVGHAAARRVRERHDPDAYAESLWRLLDALLEDPKASAAQALSHAERGRARTQRSVFGKVSVMIPTLDAGPQFERSLESIAAQEGLDELEVVVIDSGSSDETVSLARSSGARVQEIPAAEFNHGRVRNQLAESATGDVLFTTVQDATLVGKYAVRNLVLALQSDVRLAAVSARQIAGADADLYSGYQAWLRNETMALRGNAPRGSLAWSGFLVDDVCAAIPRSAWKALRFRELSYAEDIDFGMRAHDAGWRTCFADDAAVWHHHDRDAAHLLSRSAVHRRTMAALLNDLKRIPEAQPGLDALAAEMPAALGQLEAAISQATGDRESISLARCVGAVAERLAQDPPPLVPTGELAGMFALFDDHAPWDVALRAARDEAVRAGLRKWILLVLEYPWVRQYALAHSAPVARDAARAFVARCAASNLGEVVGDAMRDAPEAAVTRQVTGGAWIGSGSWST